MEKRVDARWLESEFAYDLLATIDSTLGIVALKVGVLALYAQAIMLIRLYVKLTF